MKKIIILLLPTVGFMYSCTGETNNTTKTTEVSQEQIEAIEESNQSIELVIDSSEVEIGRLQDEIDDLLNEI